MLFELCCNGYNWHWVYYSIKYLTDLNQGIDVERQQRQELQLMAVAEVRKKWHLPPAFNVEYVAYYEDRNKRILDLKVCYLLVLNSKLD